MLLQKNFTNNTKRNVPAITRGHFFLHGYRAGWGAGIRTPVVLESESSALPLGDTPIYSPPDRANLLTGWDRWIRTTEMTESKSAALPLGYIPIFGISKAIQATYIYYHILHDLSTFSDKFVIYNNIIH